MSERPPESTPSEDHAQLEEVLAASEAMPGDDSERSAEPIRTSRDVLYEQIGVALVNAGVLQPAARFVADVRKRAGFRVAPREVVVAVEQIAGARQPVTVESVVELVATLRGGRSPRQQRHADAWRTLGAQLALAGLDGSPDGQRAFIGIAHAIAGKRATDALLLKVALALSEQGERPDAELVGKIGKRLAASAGDVSPEILPTLVERELRAAQREARRPKRPPRTASIGPHSQRHNPGARKWRPGGRRRRKIQMPKDRNTRGFEP